MKIVVPLQEMYFGKSNSLLAIEDYINKIKLKYKDKYKEMYTDKAKFRELLRDPILKKIGETIKNAFGFNDVAFTVSMSKTPNAYTIPFASDENYNIYDGDQNKVTIDKFKASIIIDNKGFHYDKRKFVSNFLVCVTLGMLFRFDTGGIVAILLHEIGHNFCKAIVDKKLYSNRADEIFADRFVAMYGYGPEFTAVMQHLHHRGKERGDIHKQLLTIPLVNIIVTSFDIMSAAFLRELSRDEHPGLVSRLKSQIDMMEADLQDNKQNISPKMRQELQKKIDMCKELNKEFFNSNKDNVVDKMKKWYWTTLEPALPSNHNMQVFASKGTNPNKLNDDMNRMYKKKGFFR